MKHIIFIVSLFTLSHVRADPYHQQNINSVVYNSKCAAGAMALSAIDMSLAIPSLQTGIGGAWCIDSENKENTGIAGSMGKRVCFSENNCGIGKLSGSVEEAGAKAVTAGFVWVW